MDERRDKESLQILTDTSGRRGVASPLEAA
jgi:hypothetical protein